MKLVDRAAVGSVVIGRRVQYRTVRGQRVTRPSQSFVAVYRDGEGAEHVEPLHTGSQPEAIELARALSDRLGATAHLGTTARHYPATPILLGELITAYLDACGTRDLTPKTLAKYGVDLAKLRLFCDEHGITVAASFDEAAFHSFSAWLSSHAHTRNGPYASKTRYTALTITKQLFKWGVRNTLLHTSPIEAVPLPQGRARPQPCFTTAQVEAMLALCQDRAGWRDTHAAIALGAFAGLRLGEMLALRWADIRWEDHTPVMLHISKGGSGETTKDRDDRFVPVHPRVVPVLTSLPRSDERVLPDLRDRTLLSRIKSLCRELGYGTHYKTHSLRHHFASVCANSRVPLRMALAWMGHSSSQILSLYYHLHDDDSQAAMLEVAAKTHGRRGAQR